ncbi:hypothetical protein CBS101457_001965 [Exobasidium rhododendri]|nr:hypothetical protein CBS101457_001965 [Exobasidium rhododendri]
MASQSIYAPKIVDQVTIEDDAGSEDELLPPNPYLTKPLLYLSGVDVNLSDRDLASGVFAPFVPVRLRLNRNVDQNDKVQGTVEFQTLDKAERAYATIRHPRLSINEDITRDQEPESKPRLIKELPAGLEDVDVYDMFRPYGALASASRIVTNPQGHHTGYRGMAIIRYYHEEDAKKAQADTHCAEVEGKTISVTIDNVVRRPSAQGPAFSPSAAPFVPGGAGFQSMNAAAPAFQPPQYDMSSSHPSLSPTTIPSQEQLPGPDSNLLYSTSAATYIDPCNLFCKSLDPTIDSNQLFNLFKRFGKIVSARVMRGDNGASREFGFVSFQSSEDATRALRTMNQTMQGSKEMIVRLHEPKNVRQEKLSHKFGASFVGTSSSVQDVGQHSSDANGSSGECPSTPVDRSRRASNSYFRAAASGENGGGEVDVDLLKAMSSSLRNEVVRGELNRRVQAVEGVEQGQVDGLVSELSQMRLPEVVDSLNDSNLLSQHVHDMQMNGTSLKNGATLQGQSATSMASSTSAQTERERLHRAVTELLPADSPVEEIVALLIGLPKKERAMSLFNQEHLRKKIDEAIAIIDLEDDGESASVEHVEGVATSAIPRLTKENIALASSSPAGTFGSDERPKVYTLSDLADLPALEIIKLASSSQSAGLPLPKADARITKETNDFIDSLQDLASHDQKQKLGDQLFKKIKTFGVKGAPKMTISLLDSEDLRSLAHLMNSYPGCLREKIIKMAK